MDLLARDSIRILHIEDDDDFADLTARNLRRAGFKQPVARCHDGRLALSYFSDVPAESAPHVVLLDLHMPYVNGLDVLHWVRQNCQKSDVAVYLLTSSEDPEDRKRAFLYNVTEYLPKSLPSDQLIEKLDGLIASKNSQSIGKEKIDFELPRQELASFNKVGA